MPGSTLLIPKSKISYFTSEGETTTGFRYTPLSFIGGTLTTENLWKSFIDPNKTTPLFEYMILTYDCSGGELSDKWNNSAVTDLDFVNPTEPLDLSIDAVNRTITALQNESFDYRLYCVLYDNTLDTYSFLPLSISAVFQHLYSVSLKTFTKEISDGVTDKSNIYFRLLDSDVSSIDYLYMEQYENEILVDSYIETDISFIQEFPLNITDYNYYRMSISSTPGTTVKNIIFLIGTDISISKGIYFEFESDAVVEYISGQNYQGSINYQKKGMIYRLHPVIKNLFWEQFIEGISEELFNVYKKEAELKEYINSESSNADTLIAIATKFGYIPNRILDDSITFLQREINNIGRRIQYKGTYEGYQFIFRLVNSLGYIYNIFDNNTKFIRAVQETAMFDLLRDYISNWDKAFVGVEPFPYYSLSVDSYLLFDEGTTWDADPLDYMDELLVSHPTKHLAVEWLIQETFTDPEDSVEKLMNVTRLDYVLFSTLYNRKLTDYPHVGAQISLPCDETGYYNQKSDGVGLYTTLDLKAKCSVTPLYRSIIQVLENIIMDDTPASILDPSLSTYFDQSFTATNKIDVVRDFYKLVAGIGSKNQVSYDPTSRGLNNKYDTTIFHVGFDEYFDSYCNDSGLNLYTGELLGTATRTENGIISRSYYNPTGLGCTYFPSVVHTSVDREISFWVKGIAKIGTTGTIFNCDYLKIEKPNTANYDFKFTFTGNVTSGDITLTYNITTDPAYMTTPILIWVSFNETTEVLTASLKSSNQTVTDTLNYSTFGTVTTPTQLTVGGDYNPGTTTITNAITGYIDDVWISESIMTSDELTYLFTNQICDMTYLSKKVYEYKLEDEVYEDLLWYVVSGRIDAQKIKGLSIAKLYNATDHYTGTLSYGEIVPKSIKLQYQKQNLDYEYLADDGLGNIIGDSTCGTIDYDTGAWTFDSQIEIEVINEILRVQGTGTTHLVVSLDHANLKTGSFTLEYYSGGTRYSATPSGTTFSAVNGITSGTIDLVNGAIDVYFSPITTTGFSIRGNYTYIVEETSFNDSTYLTMEYITNIPIDITEVGIENNEGKLMVYATVPPVEMRKPDFHLSTQLLIKKT